MNIYSISYCSFEHTDALFLFQFQTVEANEKRGNEEISSPPTVANYVTCGRRVHCLVVLQTEAFKVVT